MVFSTVPSTTIITITSCSDNKCTEVPVTTGVLTVKDATTTYVTYCPIEPQTTVTCNNGCGEAIGSTLATVTPPTVIIQQTSVTPVVCQGGECESQTPKTSTPTETGAVVTTIASVSTGFSTGSSTIAPVVVQGSGSMVQPVALMMMMLLL